MVMFIDDDAVDLLLAAVPRPVREQAETEARHGHAGLVTLLTQAEREMLLQVLDLPTLSPDASSQQLTASMVAVLQAQVQTLRFVKSLVIYLSTGEKV